MCEHDRPPMFRDLSFWWYSKRLAGEFSGRLAKKLEDDLAEGEFPGVQIYSLWLTAPISKQELDGSMGTRRGG